MILIQYLSNDECLEIVRKCAEYIDELDVSEVIYVAKAAEYSYDIMKRFSKRKDIFNDLYLECKSYRGTTRNNEVELVDVNFSEIDVRNKNVVLYDTILDTGSTVNFCIKYLKNLGVNNIYPCFMFERLYNTYNFNRYACLGIEDVFIVGFGLDYNDSFRNLSAIYILEEGR